MNVIEAMETCTAMRYFKEEPVPKETLEKLIHAATRASNPGNSQGWAFLVIDDPAIKEPVGEKVLEGMAPFFADRPAGRDGVEERMMLGAEHLARNFAKVPAWIVCMARKVYPPQAPQDSFMHSTIYPAAQNLIVAARSLGIGTCFTTFPGNAEPEIRALCNIPDDLHLFVYVAVGYPQRTFMPVKRKPIDDVLTWNRF
ncbi:MAG: nitroreductase family protein [Gammaproteobacteria bacterium]|nr:nitroreductase family protein [Gammaproteobacteria bacterium]MXX29572.1 nitroreductase family protein [Gammaproteobacteria bacterium]MYE51553.1 nitroreductase family protein [Gammaproteobacteria bacterium]MYE86885.1 nitroreductase family protein [Gammaproteobacteria bacterium]MYF10682.1 nitroreductase family protein [Gammaproteobacteria bacterium]